MKALRKDWKLYLFLLTAFSFSLTTPLLHGLGYDAPALLPRVFSVVLAISASALVHAFPLLAVVVPIFLTMTAAVTFWLAPSFLEKIYLLIYRSLVLSPHFWPILIMAAASLLFYVLLFGVKNPIPLLLAAGAITFVPLWYKYVDSAYSAAVIYLSCWLLLVSLKEGDRLFGKLRQSHQNQAELEEGLQQGWMRYTVGVLLLALFLALILPKGFGPIPWTSLHNWADETFPYLSELRGGENRRIRGDGEEFGLFHIGYQETSSLGGPLWQDSTLLLEVWGQGCLYLKGSVKDFYSGSSWTNTKAADERLDSYPLPSDVLQEYLRAVDFRIKHRRLKTRTAFGVLYTREVRGLPQDIHMDANSGLTLRGGIPLGQEYRVRGYELAYRGDFAALEKEMQDEELAPLIPFLQLPANLPLRVRELVTEICGNHQGYYHKIKVLERYLRYNYAYNTDVPHLPGNRDFVDYFLFDHTEGYCTYFASSLAVMGRVTGVPTRYIEGFTVPKDPGDDGAYPVAGTNAHAWVEAYIPGVGWLPFEATPSFRTADFLPLRRETAQNGSSPTGDEPEEPLPFDGGVPPDMGPEDFPPFVPSEKGGLMADASRYLAGFFLAAVLLAIAFLSGLSLVRFHRIKRGIKQLQRQKPHLRAIGYYNLALPLLERLEAGKYPGETPREYSRRIIHQVYTWSLDFHKISEGVNMALYSGKEEVPVKLAEDSEQFFYYIYERYLGKVGKWAAFREIILESKYLSGISVLEEPGMVLNNPSSGS